MFKQQLGQRIACLRRTKGLSQEELAEKAEYSTEFISMIERGVNWPSIPGLLRIAKTLGVSIQETLDFDNTVEPSPEKKEKRPVGRPRKHFVPPRPDSRK